MRMVRDMVLGVSVEIGGDPAHVCKCSPETRSQTHDGTMHTTAVSPTICLEVSGRAPPSAARHHHWDIDRSN